MADSARGALELGDTTIGPVTSTQYLKLAYLKDQMHH